jgi:outer membrane protein W
MRYQKIPLILLTVVLASTEVFAQQSGDMIINSDLQQEITRESEGTVQEVVEVPMQMAQTAQPQTQRVLILNRTQQVQQQPITNVEATPLTDSRASQLRRAREDAEVATEQKIVEKLEQSRLEDEKRRADALFGNRLDNQNQNVQLQQEAIPVQQPQMVQVIPVQQENKESLSDVKEEIISSVREELKSQNESEKPKDKMFIGGIIGVTEYQDAVNVESNESLGLTVGSRLDDKFIVEGSFLYSNHFIDDVTSGYRYSFVYDELDQYNFIVAAKYAPKFGRISPQIGGLVSYTHRKYAEVNYRSSYIVDNNYISNESETDAFDMGVSVGLDIEIGENFVLGVEYKYITNLTSKSDSRFLNDYYSYYDLGTPLEEFDYSTFGIVAKIQF